MSATVPALPGGLIPAAGGRLLFDPELLRERWSDLPGQIRDRLRRLLPDWFLVGFLPNEGETLVGNLVFKNADVDRGSSTELGLFTNVAPGETITEATITEPTGTGYARISLTDASWSVVADLASYALQTFTAGAGGWTGSVQGYFIATTGTTARLVAIEVDSNGPYTFAENDTYDITPQVTVS